MLTADRAVIASDRILVALRPATSLATPAPRRPETLPRDGARVLVHVGTARVEATVGRSGRDSAALPDGGLAVVLRLAEPIAIAPGDRFVLRRPSPGGTLAGGRVIDADPPRGASRRRATPDRLVALAIAPALGDAWAAARLRAPRRGDGALRRSRRTSRPGWTTGSWRRWTAASDGEVSRAALRTDVARELRHHVTLDPAAAANFVSGAIERLVAAASSPRAATASATRVGPSAAPRRRSSRRWTASSSCSTTRRRRRWGTRRVVPAARRPPSGSSSRRAGSSILEDDLAYAASAYRDARAPGTGPGRGHAAHAGRPARRDRDEPQVRDGAPRGPRPARRAAPDPGRPRARTARGARSPAVIEDDGGAWRPEGVSGIVLAGGASRRFGSDKLGAVLEGRSLLGSCGRRRRGGLLRGDRRRRAGRRAFAPGSRRRADPSRRRSGAARRPARRAARRPRGGASSRSSSSPAATCRRCRSTCSSRWSGRCSRPRARPTRRSSSATAWTGRCRPRSGTARRPRPRADCSARTSAASGRCSRSSARGASRRSSGAASTRPATRCATSTRPSDLPR